MHTVKSWGGDSCSVRIINDLVPYQWSENMSFRGANVGYSIITSSHVSTAINQTLYVRLYILICFYVPYQTVIHFCYIKQMKKTFISFPQDDYRSSTFSLNKKLLPKRKSKASFQ